MRRLHIGLLILVLCAIASAQQPTSWTSRDRIALTYLFYWYDAPSGFHYGSQPLNQVTLHPPDSYLNTFSFKEPVFFEREFSDSRLMHEDLTS